MPGSDDVALDGRVAVVVGAATGIGAAIASLFGRRGGLVACLDRDAAGAEAGAAAIRGAGGRAMAAACDVTDEGQTRAAVERVVAELGPPRVLVNGAANNEPTATVLELDPDEWDRTFAVNVRGAYLMSRAVLPAMIAAGGGSIIHVASQLGSVGAPGRPAYCATKGALIQLAKAMAIDHAADGVRVNALSPGAVETGRLVRRFGSLEEARRVSGPRHVLGRLGEVEEIARVALFLASDASSFVTGSDMLVDGGYNAW